MKKDFLRKERKQGEDRIEYKVGNLKGSGKVKQISFRSLQKRRKEPVAAKTNRNVMDGIKRSGLVPGGDHLTWKN